MCVRRPRRHFEAISRRRQSGGVEHSGEFVGSTSGHRARGPDRRDLRTPNDSRRLNSRRRHRARNRRSVLIVGSPTRRGRLAQHNGRRPARSRLRPIQNVPTGICSANATSVLSSDGVTTERTAPRFRPDQLHHGSDGPPTATTNAHHDGMDGHGSSSMDRCAQQPAFWCTRHGRTSSPGMSPPPRRLSPVYFPPRPFGFLSPRCGSWPIGERPVGEAGLLDFAVCRVASSSSTTSRVM